MPIESHTVPYCLPCKMGHELEPFDMEYSDDECTSVSSLEESPSYSIVPPKPLLIDELESASPKKTNKMDGSPQKRGADKDSLPCPCCSSYVHCKSKKKNNLISSNVERINQEQQSPLSSLIDSVWSEQNDNVKEGAVEAKKGEKIEYEVVKCTMETWLKKKGSGNDVFGSKSWKSRWCQLVLAKIPGEDVQVPIFLSSWHFTVPSASTVIVLDRKIAVSVDETSDDDATLPMKPLGNQIYRFDIVDNAKSSLRTFSAPSLEERYCWVQAINAAVGTYDRARRSSRLSNCPLPPFIPRPVRITRNTSNLDGLNLVF